MFASSPTFTFSESQSVISYLSLPFSTTELAELSFFLSLMVMYGLPQIGEMAKRLYWVPESYTGSVGAQAKADITGLPLPPISPLLCELVCPAKMPSPMLTLLLNLLSRLARRANFSWMVFNSRPRSEEHTSELQSH